MGLPLTILRGSIQRANGVLRWVAQRRAEFRGKDLEHTTDASSEDIGSNHDKRVKGERLRADSLFMAQSSFLEQLQGAGPVTIVDVREPHEVEQGFIPGAVSIPLASLECRAHELATRDVVVAYCASGRRSARAARTLRSLGFSRAHSLDGGFGRWVRDGGEVLRSGDLPPGVHT